MNRYFRHSFTDSEGMLYHASTLQFSIMLISSANNSASIDYVMNVSVRCGKHPLVFSIVTLSRPRN